MKNKIDSIQLYDHRMANSMCNLFSNIFILVIQNTICIYITCMTSMRKRKSYIRPNEKQIVEINECK